MTLLHTSEPTRRVIDLSKYRKLSKEQVGHLRHFHNLSSQPDNEWRHMGSQEPMQEFLDAYRYQLATMAYAAGLAHYHHQPALRSVYQPLFRQLIHKMLLRAVWGYWFNSSLSGIVVDPDLKQLRQPWADPVARENIMYSGHLLLMVSLYAMLFDDDAFEQAGALTFVWDPLFFGMGREVFAYDAHTLQAAILREMERNGWIGVCCEPNLVFVVCNQFPLIAMRYRDVRHGTEIIPEVLRKYVAAWEKKGMVSSGLYVDSWMEKQDKLRSATDPGWTAWAAAFMNSWNSEFVHAGYEASAFGYLTKINGKTQLQVPSVGNEIRACVESREPAAVTPEVVADAKAKVAASKKKLFPYTKPMFGYTVQWLSELGKEAELRDLLEYADERLNPKWEDGGLYYPRNDVLANDKLEWTHVDPFTGNAAIGYARLNVPNGQKIMWDSPWTSNTLHSRPWIEGASLADGIDFLRGVWDAENQLLVVTLQSWNSTEKTVPVAAKNLPPGPWEVVINGVVAAEHSIKDSVSDTAAIDVKVGVNEVDIVFCRAEH